MIDSLGTGPVKIETSKTSSTLWMFVLFYKVTICFSLQRVLCACTSSKSEYIYACWNQFSKSLKLVDDTSTFRWSSFVTEILLKPINCYEDFIILLSYSIVRQLSVGRGFLCDFYSNKNIETRIVWSNSSYSCVLAVRNSEWTSACVLAYWSIPYFLFSQAFNTQHWCLHVQLFAFLGSGYTWSWFIPVHFHWALSELTFKAFLDGLKNKTVHIYFFKYLWISLDLFVQLQQLLCSLNVIMCRIVMTWWLRKGCVYLELLGAFFHLDKCWTITFRVWNTFAPGACGDIEYIWHVLGHCVLFVPRFLAVSVTPPTTLRWN